VGPTARTRCPRCAYALTGQPGAPHPGIPYAATIAPIRCPECALEIPEGAHCLVGGATPSVVDPSGSRGVLAVTLGAILLVGGPWLCIVGVTALVEYLRAGAPKRGIAPSDLQAMAFGALPIVAGIALAAWFVWRSWRRADPSRPDGERAGARHRRALVVPGGVHLWSGEPTIDAKPRSLAGGDIRDVRGRRNIPLFRRPGAAEAGAIDFVTPITLWSASDAKQAANLGGGQFAGTLWLLMLHGERPQPIAHEIERTLRAASVMAPIPVTSVGAGFEALPTPVVDGDPNRYAVPVAITAATAPERAKCPRCSHGYGEVPDGPWWEPLPCDVTCSECGLTVRAGAIMVAGSSTGASHRRANLSRGAVAWIVAAGTGGAALTVASVFVLRPIAPAASVVVQMVVAIGMPLGIAFLVRRGMRAIPRARARFQDGPETWCFEPGRLRIVTRGRPDARVVDVPAGGISRVVFGQSFAADNSMPVQTDALTVRGTAPQLGLMGERTLFVALPAEADQDVVVGRARAALRNEMGPG
jgi:hypothetical protein